MPQAVRVDDDLVEQARTEILVSNRSIGGQIEQWAKIGRAIERSPGFDYNRVRFALEKMISPDALTSDEQAVFDEEFFDLLDEPSKQEDRFFARMREDGLGVGLDEEGNLVYGENEPSRPGYEGDFTPPMRSAHDLTDDEITAIAAEGAREGAQASLDAGLSIYGDIDGELWVYHPDGTKERVPDEE